MFKNGGKIISVNTAFILPDPASPRRSIDEYELSALKNNIAKNGIICPLIVREIAKNRYMLVSGYRRLAAAKAIGLRAVPCIKTEFDTVEAEAAAISIFMTAENISCFEEAAALERLAVNGGGHGAAAEMLGISENCISEKTEILKLSDSLKARITAAGLDGRYAKELLRLPADMRDSALAQIIADGMSIQRTAEFVNGLLNPAKEPEPPVRKAAIGDIKLFSNSLAKLLDTLSAAGFGVNCICTAKDGLTEYRIRLSNKLCESWNQLSF